MRLRRRCAVLVALLMLGSIGAVPDRLCAQDEHEVDAAESGERHEGPHKNHLALFVGVTDNEAETAFSLGVDYERRFSRRFGIGMLGDYSFGDERAFVIAAPIFLYATDRLKFLLAAGFEDTAHHDAETLVRLGIEYGFEVGRFTIAPTFNVDIVEDEEILVFGVNFGRGF